MRVLMLLAALAACTSFETIDRDVCGNGLVEAGEDCDSDDPSCVGCAVTCATNADCPDHGYTCGVDRVCHAPGGVFGERVVSGPFQVNELAITDVDHDGIGDALGVSTTSIVARYGEASGRLDRSTSTTTPAQLGPPAFGDIDGDGALDVTLTTPDGLVAYGSRYGALAPVTAAASLILDAEGKPIDLRYLTRVAPFLITAFAADENRHMFLGVISFLAGSGFDAPCAARIGAVDLADFSEDLVDVYPVSNSQFLVSFITASAPRRLCVMSVHKPGLQWIITDVTPANASSPSTKPILADLDGDSDPCPGLVNTDGGAPGLRYWDGTTVNGRCTLVAAAIPSGAVLPRAAPAASTIVVGRVPVSPAVFAQASDALVMSDGIYLYEPGGGGKFNKMYNSSRRIGGVRAADLDGDAQIDAVLTAETEDDLEVLLRRTNAIVPLFPAYVVYRVDSASRVIAAEIADYDGNGHPDIAFVEQLAAYQRLMVAYGTDDLTLPPVATGTFRDVLAISHEGLPSQDDLAAITDDLFVIQSPAPNATTSSLAVLSGTVTRTMIGYIDPRPDPDGQDQTPKSSTAIASVVVGRFVGGDDVRDIAMLAFDTTGTPGPGVQTFHVAGTEAGPDASPVAGVPVTGLADCPRGRGTGMCVQSARLLTWPLADRDVVLGVDDRGDTARFDPGANPITAVPLDQLVVPATTRVRSLHAADLDGDGARELVVAAAPAAAADPGAIFVCDVDASGIPTTCHDVVGDVLASSDVLGVTACVDAAPARASAAALHDDLVLACRDADGSVLVRARRTAPDAFELAPLTRTATRIAALRAADVTGDGLHDLVAIEGAQGAQSLVVFPQCSSRNAASCARSAGSAE